MIVDEAYIRFYFGENDYLFIYYDHNCQVTLGDKFVIYMNGQEIHSKVSAKLIYHDNDWYCEGDYLIDKNGNLLAYIGENKEIVLPSNIRKIGDYAFYSAKTVESIMCSGELKEISDNAFFGCCPLKRIDLKNVEIIGESAFRGRDLTELVIPDSVKEIRKEAFYYCKKELIDHITNNSSVKIDESIISARS